MVLKLYKKEEDKTLYWEAWPEGEEIVIHFGVLGQQGETTNIPLPEFEPPETAITKHAEEARSAGFAEVEQEELFEVIVQYRIEADGDENDLETAYQVEEVLNEALGWSGLGHCDGSDVGDGTLNVYCYVVDAKVASEVIVQELKSKDLLRDVVVAYQDRDEQFVVLWPENYTGVFEY